MRSIALATCLLLSTVSAQAQSACPAQASADALEEEGQALRRTHRDGEALQRFEASWALCHGARALVRRGLAEWALGRWLDAEAHVVEGLGHREDPWVRDNHDAITRDDLAAIRTHLGSIELSGSEGRGEVWIGTRRASAWPATGPIRAVAGENVVTVRAEGFEPWRRVIMVSAGGLARESVELSPVEARSAATGTATPHPVAAVAAPPPRTTVFRPLAWTATALALAAGVPAVVTGVIYSGAVSDFEASRCDDPIDAETQTRCNTIADRRDTNGGIALASGIAAGVFAAAATALWIRVASEQGRPAGGTALTCAPTVGVAGLACAARF